MAVKTAVEIIDTLEACFAAGQIVEAIEGNPKRYYALIRLTKDADHLVPVNIGPIAAADLQSVLGWHQAKWETLMRDPAFKKWAEANPIPEPKPIKK